MYHVLLKRLELERTFLYHSCNCCITRVFKLSRVTAHKVYIFSNYKSNCQTFVLYLNNLFCLIVVYSARTISSI